MYCIHLDGSSDWSLRPVAGQFGPVVGWGGGPQALQIMHKRVSHCLVNSRPTQVSPLVGRKENQQFISITTI
jgi:hypothetical protein